MRVAAAVLAEPARSSRLILASGAVLERFVRICAGGIQLQPPAKTAGSFIRSIAARKAGAWDVPPEKISEALENLIDHQASDRDSMWEMMTRYKFCKSKEGRGSYAVIGLAARSADELRISYSESFPKWALCYEAAIQDGIRLAFDAYSSKGGRYMEFEVVEFEDFPVDTKACDVRCAAGAAAWLELGGSESDLAFEYDGKWQIRFP